MVIMKSTAMNVAIELPEDIGRQLEAAWQDMPRRALEAIAAEGYRSDALTREQVAQLLGLDFWQTEAFLKERQAWLTYDANDLRADRIALDRALPE